MDDAPKRSVRETVGQLVVIAILIGILIGAVLLLRQYINNHNSSNPTSTTATFNFPCRTTFNTVAIKSSTQASTLSTTSGFIVAAAGQLHVSNRSGATPVTSFQIPENARTGYYDIVTTVAQKGFSVTGGTIIEVRR